ncbi:NAD(P)/FAD-dependent oxidoreductase [Brucella pituitosa]|uniref:NAD(P)/FAD-dependent oxidoreductase n=1 Tax=Brucella pituitosa TaxID=571256 RepID=UPI0009A1CD88|nr:FAD-dependent oxidoreductase [Brucella pituitosa]
MTQQAVTQKRQLRQSRPYWETTPKITLTTRQKPAHRHYDVIVVGAGISGALIAQALMDGKRKIAILDRRRPVFGSTIASTAMLQHEIDVPLFKLKKHLTPGAAERIWQRSADSVEALITLTHALDIHCSMQRKKALYLAGDAYGARALSAEVEARQAIGLGAQFVSAQSLKQRFAIDRTAAIESDMSASANPAQLTAGLLRHCVKGGVEIIRDIEITDFLSLNDRVALATAQGAVMSAGAVVFCTGYQFLKALAHKNHQIISTWAIAGTKQQSTPDWLRDYLVWEASDPYLYFRTASDGRLIAGGEDETSEDAFEDPRKAAGKSQTIAGKISALIGCDIGKPAYQWSAAFGSTPTGTPMIGAIDGHPNVYAAMGYGGNGITFSKIAAEILAKAIGGGEDRDAALFAFR